MSFLKTFGNEADRISIGKIKTRYFVKYMWKIVIND